MVETLGQIFLLLSLALCLQTFSHVLHSDQLLDILKEGDLNGPFLDSTKKKRFVNLYTWCWGIPLYSKTWCVTALHDYEKDLW